MTANPHYKTWSVWTNLSFILPAIVGLYNLDWIIGLLFLGLLTTSSLFHKMPDTRLYQNLDVVNIYVILAYLPFYFTGDWKILLLAAGLTAPYIINKFKDKTPVSSTNAVTLMFLGVAVLGFQQVFWYLSILSFLIAGVFSILAEKKKREGEYRFSDIYHGLWHYFTGQGFALLLI